MSHNSTDIRPCPHRGLPPVRRHLDRLSHRRPSATSQLSAWQGRLVYLPAPGIDLNQRPHPSLRSRPSPKFTPAAMLDRGGASFHGDLDGAAAVQLTTRVNCRNHRSEGCKIDSDAWNKGNGHGQTSESMECMALSLYRSLCAPGRRPVAPQQRFAAPHPVHFCDHTHGLCHRAWDSSLRLDTLCHLFHRRLRRKLELRDLEHPERISVRSLRLH